MFLMQEAIRLDKPERWQNEWLPLAKAACDVRELTQIEADSKLWLCTAAEFPLAAKAQLSSALDAAGKNANAAADVAQSSVTNVLSTWSKRKLSVPLNSFLPLAATTLGHRMNPVVLDEYAAAIHERGDATSLEPLSLELRGIWLGSNATARRTSLQGYDRLDEAESLKASPALLWQHWLQSLARHANSVKLALKLLDEEHLPAKSRVLRGVYAAISDESNAGRHEALLALLQERSVLDDAKNLPSATLDDDDTVAAMATALTSLNRSLPEAPRTSLLGLFKQRASTKLGVALVTALLSGPDITPAALSSFIKDHAMDLEKLAPGQRAFLARLVSAYDAELKKLASKDASLSKAMAPMMGGELLALEARITAQASGARQTNDADVVRLRSDAIVWLKQLDDTAPDRVAPAMSICMDAMKAASGDLNLQRKWLVEVARKRHLLPHALAAAKQAWLLEDSHWLEELSRELSSKDATSTASSAREILDQANFIGDARTFDPLKLDGTNTVLASVTKALTAPDHGESRDATLAFLKTQKRTLGRDICRALLARDRNPALREFVEAWKPDIALLKQESLDAVRSIISPAMKDQMAGDWSDPALDPLLKPVFAAETRRMQELAIKITEAASQNEVNTNDSAFASDARRVVAWMLPRDHGAAKSLCLKALSLLESKMLREGSDLAGWNGWTLRSEFFEQLGRGFPRIDIIAFTCEMMHEDDSGELEHSGWSPYGQWGQTLHREWLRAGGDASPEQGAETLCLKLQQALGKTPPALLALGFHDFVYRLLTTEQRERVTGWAEKSGPQSKSAAVARELAVAGRLFILARPDPDVQTGALTGAAQVLPEELPLWEHYRRVMHDESVPPRVRLAIAHHLGFTYRQVVDPDVVLTGTRLFAAEMEALHAAHGYQLGAIVIPACRRVPANEAMNKAAEAMWRAWDERNSHNGEDRNTGKAFDPCEVAVLAMLQLAAHTNDDARIKKLFESFGSLLNRSYNTATIFIEEGRFNDAEKFLSEHLREVSTANREDPRYRHYSPAHVAALKKWREACKDPAVALAGEVLVTAMEDGPQPLRSAEGLPAKGARLAELAPKVSALPDDERHTRDLLAKFVPLKPVTPVVVKEQPPRKDEPVKRVLTPAQRVQQELERRSKFANAVARAAEVASKAAQGDFKAVREAHDALVAIGTGNDGRSALSDFASAWTDALRQKWETGSTQHAQEAREYLEWALRNHASGSIGEHLGSWAAMLLVLHAAKGDMDELDAWRERLNSQQQRAINENVNRKFPVAVLLKSILAQKKDGAERAAVIARVLHDPWLKAAKAPTNGWTSELIFKQKLLSPEDTVNHGEKLAGEPPDGSVIIRELAAIEERWGRWNDAGRLHALGAGRCEEFSIDFAEFRLSQCADSIRAGNKAEAIRLLNDARPRAEVFSVTRERAKAIATVLATP